MEWGPGRWKGAGEYLPFLLPHLLECICDIIRTDLLSVLKLEELIATVARHVYEDVRPVVCEQAL